MSDAGATTRWNIFARTLETIVRSHGSELSQLDNLHERDEDRLKPEGDVRELVHREQLRRLITSLNIPGSFTVLNPDDVERIGRYFRFSHVEWRQLSVALLANAVQRLVYDRLVDKGGGETQKRWAATQALRIVESMLFTLGQAFDELDTNDAAAFRAGPQPGRDEEAFMRVTDMMNPPDQKQVYAALADALDAVDRATLALSLSYAATVAHARLAQARIARDAYSDALAELDEQAAAIRASSLWRVWHDEARRGRVEADERVIDLGG